MPAIFEEFGIRFLYPDNWAIGSRESDLNVEAITLELPGGGFYSVARHFQHDAPEQLLEKIVTTMRLEYPEMESDAIAVSEDDDFFIETRFYYLDLLVTSRLTAIEVADDLVIVQQQAESREFDRNEPVFAAILRSLKDSLAPPTSI